MRRLIGFFVWRFGAGGRGPLAYRMLADALVHGKHVRRGH
jgi:hypothetical protein